MGFGSVKEESSEASSSQLNFDGYDNHIVLEYC